MTYFIQNSKHIRFLLINLFLIIGCNGFAQLSKIHYIPPLTSAEFGNANPEDQYIYISTPSLGNVNYTIKPIGQPISSEISGIVSNTTPQVSAIGSGTGQLFMNSSETSRITNNKGYVIEAEAPIYVSIRMNAGNGAQAGALVSKGLSALGNTFRIGTYTNENPQTNYLNFVSVMATEDVTKITFRDIPSNVVIKNYSGSTPISVTLNKGESYTIATNSSETLANRDGLIGALVESDKPIAVSCGSANGSFHNGEGRDYGIDQIAGLSKVGTEYIFVKGGGNNNWENVLIVAHSNNTEIKINGNPAVATINAGQYYLIEGNAFSADGNMYVETSLPVFAYQGVGSTSEANQGMFFVPPLSCETRGNIDNIANIDNIGGTNYSGGVSIVTKSGAQVTINNKPLSDFSTQGPSPVIGNANYITYKVTGLTGNVSVQGNDELYVAYFNVNGSATSGSFYSGFPSPPEINFDAEFATLGNCIPNVTLEAANAENFDSFEWWFDDGSGFIDLNINATSITPTTPGRYQLKGIITCTLAKLESAIIPVSICPDDIDNDGIIDNIDIDNDNDGILNCTESRGDVVLDLSESRPPILRFQDGATNTTLASNNISISNSGATPSTVNLNSTGRIVSNIPADIDAENVYSLTFNEPVNTKLEEDTGAVQTPVEGQYFIASIQPVNKNITLIDPDDRLLVDSNFDGVFETGIKQISGSEIHYKINPSPQGSTPYVFLANQVEGFAFAHHLENEFSASSHSAILSLTCFKQDNDGDGTKDELDLDSDNDGIADYYENQGILVSLSGEDADSDGLDDVYNSLLTPIDSDEDGVPDFYDLDSDNDGIFDIRETGVIGTYFDDNDLNGIVDGSAFGLNGWIDSAETMPDNNLSIYKPNDLDADDIFSYKDLDSDGDNCNDVTEAGLSDGNQDGRLGDATPIVNKDGLITNATDGYSIPNADYLNVAPIIIETQPTDAAVCELGSVAISVNSSVAESYQWEVSTDEGINWSVIKDNMEYNGAQTDILNLNSAPLSFNAYKYRVKLDRNGNTCGGYSDAITLTVNALPIINTPVTLVQCDDEDSSTLGFSPFNLLEAESKISSNAANETFTYYQTEAGAILGDISSSDYIDNPTAYVNQTVSNDAVWARIVSAFGCTVVSQIQLQVSTTVIPPTFLIEFSQCDDFLDTNGNNNANNNDRDGITTFDFSSVTQTVLSFIPPGQNPLPPRYYRNELDALAEKNEIQDISNYRNIGYPDAQFIYVRVDSDVSNDCLGLGAHILLNVEALPVANSVDIERACDLDNDGLFAFDTSQIQSTILGTQNTSDVTITFFDENGIALPSPLPNPFITATQTISVVVTNNTTLAPDGPCVDEKSIAFIVDAQPIANPLPKKIVCDGDLGDINDDGLYPFNTSSFDNLILGTQSNMVISYDYRDETGTLITNSPSLPTELHSGSQTIVATVFNPYNPNCFDTTSIELIVNPVPAFSVETPLIVCTSDPTFTVLLDPQESNPIELFEYEWLWTSLDGTISNQFISSDSEITVSNPGTYTITLSKTDGTSCSNSKTIFVDASELANITKENVTIKDISENNTVTIDTTNLGRGEYEFAIKGESSNFINYQKEPFFENIYPGFYTIYVQDKICGVATLDISVVGHAKFFTPNGDGVNDFWQIKGLSATVQGNSTILIFDRYGKLIKQISASTKGWDGTFNGTPLPNDDYWFKVVLDDGRVFSGHFTLKR
ncbi:T9SS type B sorting domain-containing protein [Cognatitamlana onchidii]|uniref:T9SS type B sorting domain-containing protein n=1 Tax=Cognatitamlana onchidii TaxID=2562860 RepID=UPI0010A5FE2E|nr:T9SS type B sorting domain-containing protein [Algibacter onchidii]